VLVCFATLIYKGKVNVVEDEFGRGKA